jgi:hypothetical protein
MVRASKRTFARIVVGATLVFIPLAAAGCGAASHYVLQGVAHKGLDAIVKSEKGRKDIDKAFCLDNVYHAFKDIKGHHYIFGALTVKSAIKNCEAGYSKNSKP